MAMDFPLIDYLDEEACYAQLVAVLHPDGLACPRCGARQRLGVHRRHRAPVLEYQCAACGRVFNAWTGTLLHGTHRRPSQILLILRGVAQGEPTAQLARELGCDRKHLLQLRHRLQDHAHLRLDRNPLGDAVVEADEAYINAGEKRHPAHRPGRPTAAAGQPPPWPRHLRHRPAAGRGCGRTQLG
jgi:transposase-like protein